MKDTDKIKIAELTQRYIDTHEITQTVVSTKTGVRKEYLTAILKGVFTYSAGGDKNGNIPDKYFLKLAELVDYDLKKKFWTIRSTPQLTQMLAILEESREHAYTRLIVGATGSGKSEAIRLYVKKHPADVFCVKVGSEDTLTILLDKVCKALKVPEFKHKSMKIREISRTLRQLYSYGKKPQLIFDEAEYLKVSALCSIKEFYDYLDEYCSIVLIGTNQLTGQIDKLRKKDAKGIPQLYRRIKFGIRHLPNIDKSFKLFLNDIKDPQVVDFLRSECENYGELHDVLVPCLRESDRLNEPLTLPFLKRILNIPHRLQF
jgi:DNA transposition AAA+ family ATPase